MHDVLAVEQTFALVDAALKLWSAVWPYLVMIGGFSLIVFVHELGHFAVAKWADIRVERFAVGFGRELFGFTRGETRYSFNILPLGGYVKMLGQEDFDDKSNELKFKEDPRSFASKPVGHRMAVVSAGVIMNTILAGFLFMVVFMAGKESPSPRIAFVEPDSPAEMAGLEPGDVIRKINGETILEFNEVRTAVALAPPHEPIEFIVERDGQLQPPLYINPESKHPDATRDFQRLKVGIAPGVSREILAVGPEIDPKREDQPRVGDVLVEVDGVAVTDDNASIAFDTLVYSKGDVIVERKDPKNPSAPPQQIRVEVPPLLSLYPSDPRDPNSVSVLGLTPLPKFFFVDPRGRAHFGGLDEGDIVLRWDDIKHPSAAAVTLSVRDRAERDIHYRVQKADGRLADGFVRPKRNNRGAAVIQAMCRAIDPAQRETDGPQAHFTEVRRGGVAEAAGIEPGDAVLRVNEIDLPRSSDVAAAVTNGLGKVVSFSLKKKDGRVVNARVQPQAPGSIDATFSLVADDVLQVGEITPTINGRPSPAAAAGIPAGAKITAVDGKPVARWRELIAAFRAAAGKSVELSYTSKGETKVASFAVPHTLHSLLGVGPEAKFIRIDGRETVDVKSARGTDAVSIRYHEGTKAILKELIGQTQVAVEFRPNPLAPIQTAHIDVTEEMIDPWIGRIAFAPSVAAGEQTLMLKGENALDAVWIGIHKTYYFIRMVYTTMERMIFSRSVSVEQMSGPLGIIDLGGKVAQSSWVNFVFFLAMISANLAVINFLPLPIVDGGLMIFLLIEKIKGSPVSLRVQIATQMIGLFLIIGAFIFVTYQDAVRLWG